MKREELKELGLEDEQIDKIMAINGKDIEAHKTKAEEAGAQAKTLATQLAEATKTIEGFKELDIDGVKKSAEEWKAKAEQAEADAKAQITQMKYDNALNTALVEAKVRNPKAVSALINMDGLKFNEEDGTIVGLGDQLEKIKTENDYLFESDEPEPIFSAGGKKTKISTSAFEAAVLKGAGLSEAEG